MVPLFANRFYFMVQLRELILNFRFKLFDFIEHTRVTRKKHISQPPFPQNKTKVQGRILNKSRTHKLMLL